MEATPASKKSHAERTATEPRDSVEIDVLLFCQCVKLLTRIQDLHTVTINRVDQVNDSIRLFRLGIREGSSIKFLPGQWLDTFVPGVTIPGGFTITSPPIKALLPSSPYIELAIQNSPSNPAAAWLWGQSVTDKPSNAHLQVRIGGSFVWPPMETDLTALRRVVFIAGGVGVNPLMSIIDHLSGVDCPYDVQFLYSTKASGDLNAETILFLERLAWIYGREKVQGRLRLFLTSLDMRSGLDEPVVSCNEMDVPYKPRRIVLDDVAELLGPKQEHDSVVVYICGVPSMTDEFVEILTSPDGLNLKPKQVLYEKWW